MIDIESLKIKYEEDVLKNKNGCWDWKKPRLSNSYRTLYCKKTGKYIPAHRLSWMINFGDIPKGMVICHKCDNPECSNPEHLFIGTQKDNMRDAANKGKFNYPRFPKDHEFEEWLKKITKEMAKELALDKDRGL